eukprot:366281-Chlamydomonas_euryale.AAC.14
MVARGQMVRHGFMCGAQRGEVVCANPAWVPSVSACKFLKRVALFFRGGGGIEVGCFCSQVHAAPSPHPLGATLVAYCFTS